MALPTTSNDTRPAILELVNGECLEMLAHIPDGSVDLICADLPYGCTKLDWDGVIPMDAIWSEMRRVLTPTGTIVANTAGRFTFAMGAAGLDLYKHTLIWHKTRPSQPQHSRNRPMCNHEEILVFSRGTSQHANRSKRRMTYNSPRAVDDRVKPIRKMKSRAMGKCNSPNIGKMFMSKKGFERTIQFHPNEHKPFHPTAKPVSLMEWIITCYSNEGDLILDPAMGGGSSGIAAVRLNRSFIGIERDPVFFEYAENRILDEVENVKSKNDLPEDTEAEIDIETV